MINNFTDLKFYLREDKRALNINRRIPMIFGDDIWKLEIFLRINEFLFNIKGNNLFLKILSKFLKYRFKKRCSKRCCEIPLNCIGPGLCIWHGYGIIINPESKIGSNFGVSAFCNIGHAHGNVPTVGDNVTMSFASQILGDVTICNNVTIGAKALVLKNIETEYCTVAGIPAKVIAVYDSKNMVRG